MEDAIMASYSITKIRECEKCGHIHDCAWFVEMQVLCEKLDKKINELVNYANEKEHDLEQHEMEDK
jgi:hypothetical protein